MPNINQATVTVDARGLSCPMPIVRARKAIDALQVGDVMEVLATDKGAPADFRNWCLQIDQKFIDLVQENGYSRMIIKKVLSETKEKGRVFPYEFSNADLGQRIAAGSAPVILDVRENHEYQAGHIPGAIHIPIEQIESSIPQLDKDAETAVVCRTGRRSDYACQILQKNGFTNLKNVVPGMYEWNGPVEK